MAHIQISAGLDIPIKGKPTGQVQELPKPKLVSLNLKPFDRMKFKLLAKRGDHVKIGQPIVLDKQCPERVFVSPACGVVREVRRGMKRRILDVVIEVDATEEQVEFSPVNVAQASREELIEKLLTGGLFANIRQRPFSLLANPKLTPRDIFVRALESAPFVPPAEMQVEGYEKEFQLGLDALARLTSGKVHLVFAQDTTCKAFTDAEGVEKHTASGPHPVSHTSVHISNIAPIESVTDCVWALNAWDVVAIGEFFSKGKVHLEKVVAVAGTGIQEEKRGFFKIRSGYPIGSLVANRNVKGLLRMISGDVLMGDQVEVDDFLSFGHTCFSVIPENTSREILHFFRPGFAKFTGTRAYFSGLIRGSGREYDFTTNQHGEHRGFIDGTIYDDVMPLNVPTMQLVKAVMAEDFDTAEAFGFLEVDAEDFALPTFIDPCKNEMVGIIRDGLRAHAAEVLG